MALMATDPITISLEAQQWDMVMVLLTEVAAPYKVTQPLLAAIQSQCLSHDPAQQDQSGPHSNIVPMSADPLMRVPGGVHIPPIAGE